MRLMSPFRKNFFEGVAPPDSGYKKALPFGERCSLGYLVTWWPRYAWPRVLRSDF